MSIDDELDMDIDEILAEEAAEKARLKSKPRLINTSHPDGADPVSDPSTVQKQPGAMRTTGEMTIHTKKAHRLFYGRRREDGHSGYVGLTRFAGNMVPIWRAASEDDPYADLVLLDIEAAHKRAETMLNESIAELDDILNSLGSVQLNIAQSLEPIVIELSFSVPWAFKGAFLIEKFDQLVKHCLAAAHVGLLNDEDWLNIANNNARPVRHLFAQSSRYRYTGVTRDDFAANNQAAQQALEKHGDRKIPDDVLKGIKRAKLSPNIRVNSQKA